MESVYNDDDDDDDDDDDESNNNSNDKLRIMSSVRLLLNLAAGKST